MLSGNAQNNSCAPRLLPAAVLRKEVPAPAVRSFLWGLQQFIVILARYILQQMCGADNLALSAESVNDCGAFLTADEPSALRCQVIGSQLDLCGHAVFEFQDDLEIIVYVFH